MACQYSVKAGTRRWPVAVFYNILDLACISALVLYQERSGDHISMRDYNFKLATELREDYLAERSARRSAPKQESSRTKKKSLKWKQCQVAANCKQNKTMKCCNKCKNMVCGKCTAYDLVECVTCDMDKLVKEMNLQVQSAK